VSRWLAIIRPNRPEFRAAVVLGGVMVAICAVAIAWLRSIDIPEACFGSREEVVDCIPYQGAMLAYGDALNTAGTPAAIVAFVTPIVVGIVLGIALLARELEQQTTNFAWSIAPSRAAWLRDRLVPILLLLLVVGFSAGWLGDLFQGLRTRGVDPWHSFDGLGLRGPVIAATALLVFGIAGLVGGLVGRQLPALIISGALIGFAVYAAFTVSDIWLRSDAVFGTSDQVAIGDKYLDSVVRTPEGQFISWTEAYERYGSEVDSISYDDTGTGGLRVAMQYVPGERYPAAVARLSGLLGGSGVVAIALTFIVVGRRRPY
jgi:hypothetical protein